MGQLSSMEDSVAFKLYSNIMYSVLKKLYPELSDADIGYYLIKFLYLFRNLKLNEEDICITNDIREFILTLLQKQFEYLDSLRYRTQSDQECIDSIIATFRTKIPCDIYLLSDVKFVHYVRSIISHLYDIHELQVKYKTPIKNLIEYMTLIIDTAKSTSIAHRSQVLPHNIQRCWKELRQHEITQKVRTPHKLFIEIVQKWFVTQYHTLRLIHVAI